MSPKKLARLNATQAAREQHHAALASLAARPASGLAIWRKLRRLEREAHAAATAQCCAEGYAGQPYRAEAEWDAYCASVRARVADIFGALPPGFFSNSDPRGAALKLETPPPGMWRDFGGDGVLAAEIN